MRSILIFIFISFWLISCARTLTNFSSINVNDIQEKLDKVLILHLAYDFENRKLIEDALTYWINDYGYNVYPCHRYFEEKTLPGKLELARIMKEENFDGIVITQLEDIEATERFENTQSRYNNPGDPIFYNYIDSYQNRYSTGYTFLEKAYVVNTRLYSTSDPDDWIYNSTTETIDDGNFEQAVEDFAKTIAKSLHQNQLFMDRE